MFVRSLAALLVAFVSASSVSAQTYLNNYPGAHEAEWSENMQGLAHDDDHWFITQKDWIWKIPVEHDLAAGGTPPGSVFRPIGSIGGGYDHFGDPHHIEVGEQGYLLVPIEGADAGECGRLLVIRVEETRLPTHTSICLEGQGLTAAWLATGPDGALWTSPFDVPSSGGLHRYAVDWERFLALPTCSRGDGLDEVCETPPADVFSGPTIVPLHGPAGQRMALPDVQGGVLTPDGSLMFLVSDELGLWVYDKKPSAEGALRLDFVDQSCNAPPTTSCPFSFQFDKDKGLSYHDLPYEYEEPEGIDYWNLNDGRAPGIYGELHAVNLFNQGAEGYPDDIWIKHYTLNQWVDPAGSGDRLGSYHAPYNSIANAIDNAWPGSTIYLRGGHAYPVAGDTLSDGIQMKLWGSLPADIVP